MNNNLLKALLRERCETGTDFAKVIKASEKTAYSRLNGTTQLTRDELALIKAHYKLTDERFLEIFFGKVVA